MTIKFIFDQPLFRLYLYYFLKTHPSINTVYRILKRKKCTNTIMMRYSLWPSTEKQYDTKEPCITLIMCAIV